MPRRALNPVQEEGKWRRQGLLREVMTAGLLGWVGVSWLRKDGGQADLQRCCLRSRMYTFAVSTRL